MITVGVIADTHVPDRARALPPEALEVFRQAKVAAILHAGDVIHPAVLAALEAIAPTYAVRGNRDWYFLRSLPPRLVLQFEEVKVGMCHGHGSFLRYVGDKWEHFRRGAPPFARFARRALAAFPQVDVVVFGHTHYPVCRWVGLQLLCNPGSPVVPALPNVPRAVGLLHIEGRAVWGELRVLDRPQVAV